MRPPSFEPLRVTLYLGLVLAILAPLTAAAAPSTFQPLVGSGLQDTPVCFDGRTGELGQCSTAPQTSYARSVLVSQADTGDYTSPVDALADVATWCNNTGAPSAFNRCEVRIAPGVYPLGEPLNMVDYVDIRGSGTTTTVLTGDVEFDTVLETPTGLINSAQATLSDLSVFNVSDNSNPDGAAIVLWVNTPGFRLERVTAVKTNLATAGGMAAMVVVDGGNTIIRDSFLYGQGGTDTFGLLVEESAATVRNSTIWARNGANNTSVEVSSDGAASTATILNSITDEVLVAGAASDLKYHWSQVRTGVTVQDSATGECMFSFEELTLAPLNSDCSQ